MNAPRSHPAPWRLSAGGRIDRSHTVTVTFDGKSYPAHPGDTLASALLAHGVKLVGRSFKYHRPRGILTMAGQDANTLVQLNDEPNVPADTRLWAWLQQASGGTWGGCVYDVDRIEQVIREGQLQLPLQLLNLRPQQLTALLSARLPVEQVQVTRLMLPPRLRIELVDREAVAQAQRRSGRGLEQGYVDRLGNWMTSRQQRSSASASAPSVQVLGWQERLRPALALILARRDRLGSPLQQVGFEPNGSVWLRTVRLGNVHLGPADARLERRLDVLQHLSSQLPQQIRGIKVQSIDLSDPDRPELGLPAPPGAAGAGGRSTSGVD